MSVPSDVECGVCGLQAMSISNKDEYNTFIARHQICAVSGVIGNADEAEGLIHEELSPLLEAYIEGKQFGKHDVVMVVHRNDPLFDLPHYDEREYSVYHMELERLIRYLRVNGAASKQGYPFPEDALRSAVEWVFETSDSAGLFARDSSVLSFPLEMHKEVGVAMSQAEVLS